jgi:GNAT superfamily N-acetyltransferase
MNLTPAEHYIIRFYKPEDKSFIMATSLLGLYYGDSWFSMIPKDIFMDNYKKVFEHFIDSPTTGIAIACLPDDHDVILGYSIVSSDLETLHWVFVKSAWRKQGIAKSLVPANIKWVTHLSTTGKDLLRKHKNVKFNPFKIGEKQNV